jgi:chaperonin GroES
MLKIRPLYDRLVVKREEEEETSAGGIILTDSAKEKPSRGKVLAIGEGKLLDSGDVRQSSIKIGDNVLFGKYAGTEVSLDGEDLVVMREEDVMGVIEA